MSGLIGNNNIAICVTKICLRVVLTEKCLVCLWGQFRRWGAMECGAHSDWQCNMQTSALFVSKRGKGHRRGAHGLIHHGKKRIPTILRRDNEGGIWTYRPWNHLLPAHSPSFYHIGDCRPERHKQSASYKYQNGNQQENVRSKWGENAWSTIVVVDWHLNSQPIWRKIKAASGFLV